MQRSREGNADREKTPYSLLAEACLKHVLAVMARPIADDTEWAANIPRALVRFAKDGQVLIFTHQHRHLVDLARADRGDQALAVHSL